MKHWLLIFLIFIAPVGARAQCKYRCPPTLTEETKQNIQAYDSCLNKNLFHKASEEENTNKIVLKTMSACTTERNFIIKTDVKQGLKSLVAEKITRALDQDVKLSLRQRLDRVSKEYIDAVSISRGVYENCAMANRPGAIAFYEAALNNMATDFAYYRKRANRERALARPMKEIKAKIANLGPEAWCRGIWEQTASSEAARKKLFIEAID